MANTKVTGDLIASSTIATDNIADNAVTSDKISGITTAHIAEGSNLYYTDARTDARVALVVDSAPSTLNTLNELADALGDDPNFATTTATSIGLKAPLASPSFTGNATFAGDVTVSGGDITVSNVITGVSGGSFRVKNNGGTTIATFADNQNATFAGSITTNLSSAGTYFTGGSGGIRQLSITSGTNISAHALHTFNIASSNGKYEFDVNGTTELSLDSSSATFAGDVIIDDGVGRITLSSVSGENRIQSTTTGFSAYEKLAFTADDYEFKLGNATFAGDITLNEDLNFSTNGFADISNTGTGAIRIKPSGGTTALTLTGANATFAGLVYSGDGFRTSSSNSSYNLLTRDNSNGSYPFYCQNSLGVSGDAAIARFAYGSYGANTGTVVLDVRSGTSYFNDCNVGIGTNSPSFKLDVSGDGIRSIRSTAGWAGWFENTGNSSGVVVTAGVDSGHAPLLIRKEDGTELFSVRGSGTSYFENGNVGIGTTTPDKKLHILDTSAGAVTYPLRLQNSGTTVGTDVGLIFTTKTSNGGSASCVIRSESQDASGNSSLVFFTPSSGSALERMRINSGGTVEIINNTSPKLRLTRGTKQYTSRVDNNNKFVIQEEGGNEFFVVESGASSNSIRIDSSGNVGIGVTDPGFKLDIHGDSTSGVMSVKNAANARDTFRSENAAGTRTFNIGNDANGHANVLIRNSSGTVTSYLLGSGNSYINGGNVGIGTTSPDYKLDVSGSSAAGFRLTTNGFTNLDLVSPRTSGNLGGLRFKQDIDTYQTGEFLGLHGGGFDWKTGSGSAVPTSKMSMDSSGNVGIGVTPFATSLGSQSVLDIGHAGSVWGYQNYTYLIANAYYDSGWLYKNTASAGVLQIAGDELSFRQAPSGTANAGVALTQPFTIKASGNVGIGATSPDEKLSVDGNIFLQGNDDYIAFNTSASSGHPKIKMNTDADFSFLNTAGANTFHIENGGNVGIGITSPKAKLDVDGDANTTGYNSNTLEFSTFFTSGSNQVIATLSSPSADTTCVATIEYVALYNYGGTNVAAGVIMASTRYVASVGNTYQQVNDITISVSGNDTSLEPTLFWVDGINNENKLKINVASSVQITARVRITYHNATLTRNYAA